MEKNQKEIYDNLMENTCKARREIDYNINDPYSSKTHSIMVGICLFEGLPRVSISSFKELEPSAIIDINKILEKYNCNVHYKIGKKSNQYLMKEA